MRNLSMILAIGFVLSACGGSPSPPPPTPPCLPGQCSDGNTGGGDGGGPVVADLGS